MVSTATDFLGVSCDPDDQEPVEKILLTTYPRSGNTLLRSYLERLTRVVTGSDCEIKRPLNRALRDQGLEGEGYFDESVWVVKSHYPERKGRSPFAVNKCLIIVRNPLDCIFSLLNMITTTSHNQNLDPELLDRVLKGDTWTSFIR